MLQIRLLRVGKKHHSYFRLVLVNKGKRPGKYLESLGFYSPTEKKNRIKNIKIERVKYWISKGAQTTPTVHNVLIDAKAIQLPKIKIKISKGKKTASDKSAENEKKNETKPDETKKTETKPA